MNVNQIVHLRRRLDTAAESFQIARAVLLERALRRSCGRPGGVVDEHVLCQSVLWSGKAARVRRWDRIMAAKGAAHMKHMSLCLRGYMLTLVEQLPYELKAKRTVNFP